MTQSKLAWWQQTPCRHQQSTTPDNSQLATLRAEVERLRGALEEIDSLASPNKPLNEWHDPSPLLCKCYDIARNALHGGDHE